MSNKQSELSETAELRRHWMGVLARARQEELELAWERLADKPAHHFLRAPEIGLAMVQARMGGTGRPFHVAEMTVTRCAVSIGEGWTGHAYVSGRCPRHAELAAVFDALLQDIARREVLLKTLIGPLQELEEQRRRRLALKTAATRVEFFTMVRGGNGDE